MTALAMVVSGLFGVIAVLFAVGETFSDPGGWAAVGLTTLWLVPLLVLLVLAVRLPSRAQTLLVGLSAVWLGLSIWSALAPQAWRDFESGAGPVRALGCLALVLPVAALGWHRPLVSGVLLVLIGVVSVMAVGSAPLRAVALFAVIVGALLIAAGLAERGHHDRTAGPPARPAVPAG